MAYSIDELIGMAKNAGFLVTTTQHQAKIYRPNDTIFYTISMADGTVSLLAKTERGTLKISSANFRFVTIYPGQKLFSGLRSVTTNKLRGVKIKSCGSKRR